MKAFGIALMAAFSPFRAPGGAVRTKDSRRPRGRRTNPDRRAGKKRGRWGEAFLRRHHPVQVRRVFSQSGARPTPPASRTTLLESARRCKPRQRLGCTSQRFNPIGIRKAMQAEATTAGTTNGIARVDEDEDAALVEFFAPLLGPSFSDLPATDSPQVVGDWRSAARHLRPGSHARRVAHGACRTALRQSDLPLQTEVLARRLVAAAEAVAGVVVDDPDRLKERVADDRAHELEAALPEVSAQPVGEGRRRGQLGSSTLRQRLTRVPSGSRPRSPRSRARDRRTLRPRG